MTKLMDIYAANYLFEDGTGTPFTHSPGGFMSSLLDSAKSLCRAYNKADNGGIARLALTFGDAMTFLMNYGFNHLSTEAWHRAVTLVLMGTPAADVLEAVQNLDQPFK